MSDTQKYSDWLINNARQGKTNTSDFQKVLKVYNTFEDKDESLLQKLSPVNQPELITPKDDSSPSTFDMSFARKWRATSPVAEFLQLDYLAAAEINPETGTFSTVKDWVKPSIQVKDTWLFSNVLKQDDNFQKTFNNDLVGFKDKRALEIGGVGGEFKFPKDFSIKQKMDLIDKYDGRELIFSDGQTQLIEWVNKDNISFVEAEKQKADTLFQIGSSPMQLLLGVATNPDSPYGTSLLSDLWGVGDVHTIFNPFGSRSIDSMLDVVGEGISADPKYAAYFAKEQGSGRLFWRRLGGKFNALMQAGGAGTLFVYGEGLEFTKNSLNKIPGIEIESFGGAETSLQREAILTRWFPNAAKDFQMKMNAEGIYDVSIETAERVLSFSPNVVERGYGVAAESVALGGLLANITRKMATTEAAKFIAYSKKHGKKFGNPEDLLEGYLANKYVKDKYGRLVGPRGAGYFGTFLTALQRGKMANATQLWQSTLPTKLNIEVKAAKSYADNIAKKIILEKPAAGSVRARELSRLQWKANETVASAKAWSNVPPFLREMGKAELRVVLYGAAGGQIAQDFGFDPAFGEILGILQGAIIAPIADMNRFTSFLNIDSDVMKAYENMQYITLRGFEELGGISKNLGFDVGVERGTYLTEGIRWSSQKGLAQFTDVLGRSDPELVAAVKQRVQLLNKYKDRLIQAGMPEDVFDTTLSKLTGLSVLQAFDSVYGEAISSGVVLTTEAIEQGQKVNALRARLNDELRETMQTLAPKTKGNELSVWLAKMDNGIKESEKRVKIISNALDIATKNQKNILIAGLLDASSDATTKNVNEAVETIFEYGRVRLGPDATIEDTYKANLETANKIQNDIAIEVKKLINQYENSASRSIFEDTLLKVPAVKKQITKEFDQKVKRGEISKGASLEEIKKQKQLIFQKISKQAVSEKIDRLLEVSIEARRAEIRDRGELIYKNLDETYKGVSGNGTEFFKTIIAANIDTSKPLKNMNKEGVLPSDLNNLVSAFNNTSRKMLDEFDIPPEAIIEDMEKAGFKVSNPSESTLLYFIMTNPKSEYYETAKDIVFEIGFEDMYKIKSAIDKKQFQFSSLQTGVPDGVRSQVYSQLSNDANSVFDNFMLPNGERVPELNDVITQAKDSYKKDVADVIYGKDSFFVKWLKADRSMTITQQRPAGKAYKNDSSTWINMDKIADGTEGEAFSRRLEEGFGELQEDGTYAVDISKYKGFQSVLDFKIKNWIVQQRKSDKRIEEIDEGIRNIEKALHIKGNTYFSNPNDYVGDSGYFSLTEAARRNEDIATFKTRADLELNTAFENQLTPVRIKFEAEQKNINSLRRLITDRAKKGDVTQQGGQSGQIKQKEDAFNAIVGDVNSDDTVARLRIQAKQGGMSDQEFDTSLKSIVSDYIGDEVYNKTGRKILGLDGKTGNMEVFDTDFNRLEELLKVNPDQLRTILGDEHYETLTDIAAYMKLESAKNAEQVALTGIPRALSVESYISRLYSINREVVSPKYVATETAVQQYRLRNIKLLKQIIQDKDVAKLFGEMIQTGKPLSREKNNRFFASMVIGAAKYSAQQEYTIPDLYIKPVLGATVPFTETKVGDVPIPAIPYLTKGTTLNKQMQSLKFMGVIDETGKRKGDIAKFSDETKQTMGANQ